MIKVNEKYFEIIDTEEKAYWLGYIWADGYSSRKAPWFLCIQTKDIEHLKLFCKNINYQGKIKMPKISGGFANASTMGRITICRKKICNDINNLGRYNQEMIIPEKIPNKLIRHFIRGYFDGDGSVYTYIKSGWPKNAKKRYFYNRLEVSIIGTISILDSIRNNILNIKTRIKKSKTDYMKYLVISNKKDTQEFYNYLYENATIYLERKYSIFKKYYCPSEE
jgi:intein/homing endonuclease